MPEASSRGIGRTGSRSPGWSGCRADQPAARSSSRIRSPTQSRSDSQNRLQGTAVRTGARGGERPTRTQRPVRAALSASIPVRTRPCIPFSTTGTPPPHRSLHTKCARCWARPAPELPFLDPEDELTFPLDRRALCPSGPLLRSSSYSPGWRARRAAARDRRGPPPPVDHCGSPLRATMIVFLHVVVGFDLEAVGQSCVE